MRNRLSLILASFALLVPAVALSSAAAQAAPAYVVAAPNACDPATQGYNCTPTDTPTEPPRQEPDPTPTPMLPQTGADAGVLAGVGGGVLLVGVVIALWATVFRRRQRFEA
ncbi:LPXTG cell wall anchor domain-containing protein [Asanoa iriomotensis]|uniref:LPXTG-motif cell wall-anchored protein n=1 Tax=Asanoa iriomotensis TaxID=234613 RepID=A0ABQ4C3D7_9ACTN|nr:LPXTG cell wall anchor domain-containing protein [Asanoa iriomotensis]GIF57284.1 hypothetical protein Air01nite_33790 [Asanoa iriomotensis]